MPLLSLWFYPLAGMVQGTYIIHNIQHTEIMKLLKLDINSGHQDGHQFQFALYFSDANTIKNILQLLKSLKMNCHSVNLEPPGPLSVWGPAAVAHYASLVIQPCPLAQHSHTFSKYGGQITKGIKLWDFNDPMTSVQSLTLLLATL